MTDLGAIPHSLLDRLYHRFTTGDLVVRVVLPDVSNPPTDAQLDAQFGPPAEVGAGFMRVIDDNGAGSNLYLVLSDGSNWWHIAATKAV